MIQKEPGFIVGPITWLLGIIFNTLFGFVYSITPAQGLGITIILLTIIVRCIMLPLGIKSQKSMQAMQALQPEVEKIRAKYTNKSDREGQNKMNMEIQKLYSDNNVNMLAGCLPILLQMPIFVALNQLMNNTYKYVTIIGDLYEKIGTKIMEVPGYVGPFKEVASAVRPKGMELDIAQLSDVVKVVNKMTPEHWESLFAYAPEQQVLFSSLLEQKAAIETFFSINLTTASGWAFPGILIPIAAALATFLSSYVSMRQQPATNNPQAQANQKVMLYFMPIMIGWMTINFTAGVGLYWVTSSVFQAGQQLILGKRFNRQAKTK